MSGTNALCKTHPSEKLDFFCTKHNTLVCATCKNDDKSFHQHCPVVPIGEADVTKIRDEFLPAAVDRVKKQLLEMEGSGGLIDALAARQERFEKSVAEVGDKIRAAFSSLREAIDQRERELLSQLEEISGKGKYKDHRKHHRAKRGGRGWCQGPRAQDRGGQKGL